MWDEIKKGSLDSIKFICRIFTLVTRPIHLTNLWVFTESFTYSHTVLVYAYNKFGMKDSLFDCLMFKQFVIIWLLFQLLWAHVGVCPHLKKRVVIFLSKCIYQNIVYYKREIITKKEKTLKIINVGIYICDCALWSYGI